MVESKTKVPWWLLFNFKGPLRVLLIAQINNSPGQRALLFFHGLSWRQWQGIRWGQLPYLLQSLDSPTPTPPTQRKLRFIPADKFFLLPKRAFLLWLFFFLIFFCLLGPHLQHMGVPRLGVKSELQLLAYATATTTRVQAVSASYTTVHSKVRSLTHWVRPGIKPASSRILVRIVNHWAMKGTPSSLTF